jgi:hypothetical protein
MCLCETDEEGQMDHDDLVATTFASSIKIINYSLNELYAKLLDDKYKDHEDIIVLLEEAIKEFQKKVSSLRNEWKTRVNTALEHLCKGSNNSVPSQRSSPTTLVVELPNGIIINERTPAAIFVRTIMEYGIEKVRPLGLQVYKTPLISSEKHPKRNYSQHERDGVFITSPNCNKYKNRILDKIEDSLNCSIKASLT